MSSRPLARSTGLIVDNIGDELLVYDSLSNRAHSLNSVGSAVWQACDGTRAPEEIAAHTGLDLAAVELALDTLEDIELISDHQRTGISRRTALRRITVGAAGLAVALPVIRSITAPSAAMAAYVACVEDGIPCSANSDCCSTSYCGGSSRRGSCVVGTPRATGSSCSNATSCQYPAICVSEGERPRCFPQVEP